MYDGSLFQSLTILIEKVLMYDGSLFLVNNPDGGSVVARKFIGV